MRPRRFKLGLEQASLELLFASETFAFAIDCNRVTQQAAEAGAGDDGIAEDLAPRAEALIAGDNDRATLVTARGQMEEQVGVLAADRQIADRAADQQTAAGSAA